MLERATQRYITVAAVSLAFGISLPAESAITAVDTSPNNTNVPLARSTSVAVGWSATTDTAGPVTVSSTQGMFRTPSGVTLGTVNKILSKSIVGPTNITFSEVVLIPMNIIYRAHKMGFDQLRYERSFTDGVAATGQITLFITSPKAATFGISRLALLFDDDQPIRIVNRRETLKARVAVAVVGTGLLQATWEVAGPNLEVAGPNLSADSPVYRPLKTVRQYLSAGDETALAGPELPTDRTGAYLVRLRVAKPELGFDAPVIRYFVQASKAE